MRISDWSSDVCSSDLIETRELIDFLTPQCNEEGEKVYQLASFDVIATRRDAGPARTVTLPYYATVLQGGTAAVATRLGNVAVTFGEGPVRGTGRGQASGSEAHRC